METANFLIKKKNKTKKQRELEEKMSGFLNVYEQFYFIVDFQDRRERINESVSHEVQSIFKGKTTNQLLLLEEQIKKKLQGGEGVDVGQWMRPHHNENGRMSLTDHEIFMYFPNKVFIQSSKKLLKLFDIPV